MTLFARVCVYPGISCFLDLLMCMHAGVCVCVCGWVGVHVLQQ